MTFALVVAFVNRLLGALVLASGLYFIARTHANGSYLGMTMGLGFAGVGILGLRGRLLRQRSRAQDILLCIGLSALTALPCYFGWEAWRAHTLLEFCTEARVGMTLPELFSLER